jgi:two-component system, LuxR family, response regulator FixJ
MERNSLGHSHSVGIIIDDPAVRDSVRILLESHGLAVTEYSSATDYLRKPCENCVLVIDLALSGLSGLDLAQILRDGGIQTPIIFKVDVITPAQERRVDAMPRCAWLNKPTSPAALLGLIETSCQETARARRA